LFKKTGNAILDELFGDGSRSERIIESKEESPSETGWPKLRHSQQYIREGDTLVYIWAWYEISNPRDGDFIGAGISIRWGDDDKSFVISGEDGGSKLEKVEINGENIYGEIVDDWVALFQLIEGSDEFHKT
jgi:hypothetical protein